MSSMHRSLASSLVACAAALVTAGCHAPWSFPGDAFSRPTATTAASTADKAPATAPRAGSTSDADSATLSASLPTDSFDTLSPPTAAEPDLTGVLDKLQQVGEMDPAAQQSLMDQLRRTDPKFWPSVAEQFRASLAYHYELQARSPHVQRTDTAATRPNEQSPTAILAQRDEAIAPDSASASRVPAPIPPSTLIGSLPDPRRADADGISSEALAHSSPYAQLLPFDERDAPPNDANQLQAAASVPARFETSANAYPITAVQHAQQHKSPPPDVRPAAFETVAPLAADDEVNEVAAKDKDWQHLVAAAVEDLSRRVADSPATTAEVHQHASLRMLRLLAGQTEEALQPIPHISPVEQDYWSRQIFALATYLDHHSQPDDKRRAAASVTHLDEAVAHLRDLGTLSLRNFTFCKNIYGYGAVETFPEDRFSPGQQVSLYVEAENYHSRSTEKGFCTSLGSTYEILDEKGERIDGGEFPVVDDCCRTRRRDFHIQFGVTLPEKISPGHYQFELVVRDRQSDKIAHANAAFEIRGR